MALIFCRHEGVHHWSGGHRPLHGSEHLPALPRPGHPPHHRGVCWCLNSTHHQWRGSWTLAAVSVWQGERARNVRFYLIESKSAYETFEAHPHVLFSEMLYYLVENQMFLFYFHSKWNKETFDYLQSFLSSPDSVKMGIFLQSGYDLCTETVPVRSFSFPSLKCLIFKMYSSVKFNVAHVACRWYVIERKQC